MSNWRHATIAYFHAEQTRLSNCYNSSLTRSNLIMSQKQTCFSSRKQTVNVYSATKPTEPLSYWMSKFTPILFNTQILRSHTSTQTEGRVLRHGKHQEYTNNLGHRPLHSTSHPTTVPTSPQHENQSQ